MKRTIIKIVLVLVIVIAGSLALVANHLISNKGNSPDIIEEDSTHKFAQGENEIIMVSETGSLSEGKLLPSDFDLKTYLPNLPTSTKILSVIDNNRDTQRKISAKFEIYKPSDEFADSLILDLESRNWEKILLVSENVVEAELDDVRLVVDIQNIDRYKTHATFVWIQSKN